MTPAMVGHEMEFMIDELLLYLMASFDVQTS